MKQDLRNELLKRGFSGILQLSEVIGVTSRHIERLPEDDEVMRATLSVINELLNSGYVIVGDVTRNGESLLQVHSWGLNTTGTMGRIEDEWNELGRLPNLGEVCWLELTDAGRGEARSVIATSGVSDKQPLKLDDLDETTLKSSQGFLAMGRFLRAYFDRTKGTGAIATICSDVEIESNKMSSDQAALSDWVQAVNEVLEEW
jgi:hypothetical protein